MKAVEVWRSAQDEQLEMLTSDPLLSCRCGAHEFLPSWWEGLKRVNSAEQFPPNQPRHHPTRCEVFENGRWREVKHG